MSEYQYYEWLALDRPLTPAEQKAVNGLSSHIDVSATHAVVTYSYGDFKHDPKKVLAKYFDAMLYITNWGSRQLMFRFPRAAIRLEDLRSYVVHDGITIEPIGDYIIIDMQFNEDGGGSWDWIEGEGLLSGLVPLRRDILQGDYRSLYLVWLRNAYYWNAGDYSDEDSDDDVYIYEPDEEELSQLEPPVPPNLDVPYAALTNLIDFFGINPDLVASAASASPKVTMVEESLVEKIPLLSEDERNTFLARLIKGEAHLDIALTARLRALNAGQSQAGVPTQKRRTIAEIIAPMKEYQQQRKAEEKQRAEAERLQRLEEIAKQEQKLWAQVPGLIDQRQSKAYDEAAEILTNLRALAVHRNQVDAYIQRLKTLMMPYHSLRSMHERIRRNGLLQP